MVLEIRDGEKKVVFGGDFSFRIEDGFVYVLTKDDGGRAYTRKFPCAGYTFNVGCSACYVSGRKNSDA